LDLWLIHTLAVTTKCATSPHCILLLSTQDPAGTAPVNWLHRGNTALYKVIRALSTLLHE